MVFKLLNKLFGNSRLFQILLCKYISVRTKGGNDE